MSEAAFSFGIVGEARADRDAACGLADRVLLEDVHWLDAETLDAYRHWRGFTPEAHFLRWASVSDEWKLLGLKPIFGEFGEQPDARMARKALLLFAQAERRPDAVVLMRDSDAQRDSTGLEQARDHNPWPFKVIIGLAHPKRECWVLAGFDPKSAQEVECLAKEERRLSFHPVRDAHLLTAREHGAKKDAKVALDALTQSDKERERECLEETALETLRERGGNTGLTTYLAEVRERLVPILMGHSPTET